MAQDGHGGKMQLVTLSLRLKEAMGCPLSGCPCDSTAKSQGLSEAKKSGKVRNRKYAITCSNEESPGDIGEGRHRCRMVMG